MARQTSIETYNRIKASGRLRGRRWQTYDYIYQNGPCTAWAAWKALAPEMNVSSIMGRFSELERAGAIQIVGQAINPATSMPLYLWDTTDKEPTGGFMRPSIRKVLETALKEIWKISHRPTLLSDRELLDEICRRAHVAIRTVENKKESK